MVIFGLVVWSNGKNNSVIQFLFIRSVGFSLMALPPPILSLVWRKCTKNRQADRQPIDKLHYFRPKELKGCVIFVTMIHWKIQTARSAP